MSPDSLPKERKSAAPVLAAMETPQEAKSSALATDPNTGISNTRSAPERRAILVRIYLWKTAGAPLWTKSPLMTAMTKPPL